nr:unnamed protein product [Digitaria exilis]
MILAVDEAERGLGAHLGDKALAERSATGFATRRWQNATGRLTAI